MTPPSEHLLLTGPRGVGKSMIGRLLCERLDRTFIDLDDLALSITGRATVHDVWQTGGEPAWRGAERDAFAQCLAITEPVVIALGGGAVMVDEIADAIRRGQAKGRTKVIYLRATPQTLQARLTADPGDRPSLTGDDPAAEIGRVLARREPTYRGLADAVIDVDDRSASDVVAEVMRFTCPDQ